MSDIIYIMKDESNGTNGILKPLLKWLAGIAATVVGGVILYYVMAVLPKINPTGSSPGVIVIGSSSKSQTGADLNAIIYPNGYDTIYWIEYGIEDAFDHSTVKTAVTKDFGEYRLVQTIEGLNSGESYSFRVLAENSAGTAVSGVKEFTTYTNNAENTDMPDPTAIGTSNISYDTAVLKGTINPNNLNTEYWFEYGIGDFSNSTESFYLIAADKIIDVEVAVIGLDPGIDYKFRIACKNDMGTARSNIRFFTTKVK